MGGERKVAVGEGENRRQTTVGKGAEGTGDADCHGQFANWLCNDTFSRSAVGFLVVRRGGALLPTVVPTD